jgi:hypothetical protein
MVEIEKDEDWVISNVVIFLSSLMKISHLIEKLLVGGPTSLSYFAT